MNTREMATEYRLAHWAGIMQERKESGLNIKVYCEKEGIHANVYYYWQKKLREAACERLSAQEQVQAAGGLSVVGFAEVQLKQHPAQEQLMGSLHQMTTEISQQDRIYIKANGIEISADGNYPVDKLHRGCGRKPGPKKFRR